MNLVWYRLRFALPSPDAHIWVPWKLHLEATGNGFIYLNGHALGRWWEIGPQKDFFLPECWLNFGPGTTNVVTLCLRPTKGSPSVSRRRFCPIGISQRHAERRTSALRHREQNLAALLELLVARRVADAEMRVAL